MLPKQSERAELIATTVAAIAVSLAVIEGDTVHLQQECYLLLGIDAAEIHHPQCDAERRLGELTKHRLEARSAPDPSPSPPTRRQGATNTGGGWCIFSSKARTPPAF